MNQLKKIPRILHYPGSKWSMAEWIISKFSDHETYLEPFFGSGAVFFNKAPSIVETINDLDEQVVNLFKVIRDHSDELTRLVEYTPLSRQEYYASYERSDDPIEDARRFLIRCWQAIGAKTSDRTGWRSIIAANGPKTAREWATLPYRIQIVADRLKEAQIENQPALKVIERYNRPEVLIYADPPYILETRTKRHYKCEMSTEDHEHLLSALDKHTGPVILSGYDHEMYNSYLPQWEKEIITVTAEAGAKRNEVIWINPIAVEKAQGQLNLFN